MTDTSPVFEATVSDDRTMVIFRFKNPSIELRMDLTAVDDMLKNLGEFRALMTPEIHRVSPLGQKVFAINNPMWATEPDVMLGHSLLHLRDPRFGWLHYLFPRNEARKLADLLQTQSDNPPPGQESGKPN